MRHGQTAESIARNVRALPVALATYTGNPELVERLVSRLDPSALFTYQIARFALQGVK